MKTPDKTTKRGYDPKDDEEFSGDALSTLHDAQNEVQWLVDRGYNIKSVVDLAGNHHQLSARQRFALQRTIANSLQYIKREASRLQKDDVRGKSLNIDGFNLIIVLEAALSGSPVFLGKDGVLRDLAGLRGTYRIIDKTDLALSLIGKAMSGLSIQNAAFYLDKNVSNSGRLKSRIQSYAVKWKTPVETFLIPDVDAVLSKMECVVTGDSAIIDQCVSWVNLSRFIVDEYIKNAWIVSL
ncbi:MAG: DUF434 domain-containing protein [Saccharofermentanales bacterium]